VNEPTDSREIAPLEFDGFGKIARLNRDCTITEKIDGTNANIVVPLDDAPCWSGHGIGGSRPMTTTSGLPVS
jgi:hypothetical protein